MRDGGIEPPRSSPPDFKSSASASSANLALYQERDSNPHGYSPIAHPQPETPPICRFLNRCVCLFRHPGIKNPSGGSRTPKNTVRSRAPYPIRRQKVVCGMGGSNPRPVDWQPTALPAELIPRFEAPEGIEPPSGSRLAIPPTQYGTGTSVYVGGLEPPNLSRIRRMLYH